MDFFKFIKSADVYSKGHIEMTLGTHIDPEKMQMNLKHYFPSEQREEKLKAQNNIRSENKGRTTKKITMELVVRLRIT